MERTAAHFIQEAQRSALRFAEADTDGDLKLNFEEFLRMQPTLVRDRHTDEQIHNWFVMADFVDGNGEVGLYEFFMWTLTREFMSNPGAMSSLRTVFNLYDGDSSGYIDESDFHRLCTDLGFGVSAHDFFVKLDDDCTHSINYLELLDKLPNRVDKSTRALSESMAQAWLDHDKQLHKHGKEKVDTSNWLLNASEPDALAEQLRVNLQRDSKGASMYIAKLANT